MDETEQLNKKDITGIVTGKCFDFDDDEEFEEDEEQDIQTESMELQPGEMHPLVGVMDMLICTSQEPLRKHGYPEPNLSIWEEWGKPNLSRAFVQYLPMNSTAGAAVNSPGFAALIGVGALALSFLPVLLHFIDKKKEEKQEEEKARQEIEEVKPAGKVTQPVVKEENRNRIQTADNPAQPQFVKLPGGGNEATPNIPMMELIARNMAVGNEQPI